MGQIGVFPLRKKSATASSAVPTIDMQESVKKGRIGQKRTSTCATPCQSSRFILTGGRLLTNPIGLENQEQCT